MRILRTFDELATTNQPACVAIGVFDGVHLGHQRVITQARDDARANHGMSVVLTFDPHPIRVLRPDQAPLLLTSTAHKLALIEQLGVDACLVLAFDQHLAETPPKKFIDQLAAPQNHLREICVGTRFRFGHNRTGDVRLLEKYASQFGFLLKETTAVNTADGEMISSTAVRQHVLAGRLDRAALMLGRPFAISGSVEHGEGVGRKIGYRTANINPHNEALPPNGVYAVRVRLAGQTHGGIVNIGVQPTFTDREKHRRLEAHLFDFEGDLYGQEIEVTFLQKLRDEKKFDLRRSPATADRRGRKDCAESCSNT